MDIIAFAIFIYLHDFPFILSPASSEVFFLFTLKMLLLKDYGFIRSSFGKNIDRSINICFAFEPE